ncbi:MAG: hypothetical protein ACKPAH_02665, partial [Verrucomicrobiota bacterium]
MSVGPVGIHVESCRPDRSNPIRPNWAVEDDLPLKPDGPGYRSPAGGDRRSGPHEPELAPLQGVSGGNPEATGQARQAAGLEIARGHCPLLTGNDLLLDPGHGSGGAPDRAVGAVLGI